MSTTCPFTISLVHLLLSLLVPWDCACSLYVQITTVITFRRRDLLCTIRRTRHPAHWEPASHLQHTLTETVDILVALDNGQQWKTYLRWWQAVAYRSGGDCISDADALLVPLFHAFLSFSLLLYVFPIVPRFSLSVFKPLQMKGYEQP
jgi:hypothetical protein